VLTAPIFSNLRNFERERDTLEKHDMKSLDLQKIYQFDLGYFVVSRFVPKFRRFEKLELSILF